MLGRRTPRLAVRLLVTMEELWVDTGTEPIVEAWKRLSDKKKKELETYLRQSEDDIITC